MKLRNILNEIDINIKNNLYHATNFQNFQNILKSGYIIPSAYRELKYQIKNKKSGFRSISLTRNLDFAKKWDDVIFVIDKNMLSTNFKIYPFSAFQQKSKITKNEFEEFVIKPIPMKMVKKILLPKTYKSEIFTNIPIEYY